MQEHGALSLDFSAFVIFKFTLRILIMTYFFN